MESAGFREFPAEHVGECTVLPKKNCYITGFWCNTIFFPSHLLNPVMHTKKGQHLTLSPKASSQFYGCPGASLSMVAGPVATNRSVRSHRRKCQCDKSLKSFLYRAQMSLTSFHLLAFRSRTEPRAATCVGQVQTLLFSIIIRLTAQPEEWFVACPVRDKLSSPILHILHQ